MVLCPGEFCNLFLIMCLRGAGLFLEGNMYLMLTVCHRWLVRMGLQILYAVSADFHRLIDYKGCFVTYKEHLCEFAVSGAVPTFLSNGKGALVADRICWWCKKCKSLHTRVVNIEWSVSSFIMVPKWCVCMCTHRGRVSTRGTAPYIHNVAAQGSLILHMWSNSV